MIAAGERPTQNAIIKRIGGSYTTFGPLFAEWEQVQAQSAAANHEQVEVPGSVTSMLREAVEDVTQKMWLEAQTLAATAWDKQREELEARLARLTDELVQARTAADEALEAMAGERDALASELDAIRQRAEAAQRAAAEAHGIAETLRAEVERLGPLEAAVARLTQQAADEKAARDKAEDRADTAIQEAAELRGCLAERGRHPSSAGMTPSKHSLAR